MKKFLPFLLLFCLSCGGTKNTATTSPAPNTPPPDWVYTKPSNNNYYFGVGQVSKKEQNYKDKARNTALANMAGDISVTVMATAQMNNRDKNGRFSSDYSSNTRTEIMSTLEGYELADSWEDAYGYWVMYKLSKEVYERLRSEKMQSGCFDGGNGTAQNPFRIATSEHLSCLAQQVNQGIEFYKNVHFRLVADIDLEGKKWKPIGFRSETETVSFQGHFHGGGHVIKNLRVDDRKNTYMSLPKHEENYPDYVGFFGYIHGSLIDSLGLENVYLGRNRGIAGGLAGRADSCTITAVYTTGTVLGIRGTYDRCCTGGLVGSAAYSYFLRCYSTADIQGDGGVGGLVGYLSYGSVKQSFATGNMTHCSNQIGGLAGIVAYSQVENCYATGSISSTSDAGGLVGMAYHGSIIKNCYATGYIEGSLLVGGVVGEVYNGSQVEGCVAANDSVCGSNSRNRVVGKNMLNEKRKDSELKNNLSYNNLRLLFWPEHSSPEINAKPRKHEGCETQTGGSTLNGADAARADLLKEKTYRNLGWDFKNVWTIEEGKGLPRLR